MKKIVLSLMFAMLPFLAVGDTFTRFTPATGILVGNSNSPTTTAATSANVISLWSGTCNASTLLKGDGSCGTVSNGVTSVGLTVPSGLSVTGSPITSTGTFGITTSLSGPLRGTGSGFATAASSDIISLWSGTCNSTTFMRADGSCQAISGGSGGTVTSVGLSMPSGFSVTSSPITTSGTLTVSTTLNGVLRGTGTGFTTASSSNIIGLWSGTCNSSTFLAGDGSCTSISGTTAANPTATIGATAVNGTATTYMRSDAAPALPATLPALSGANLTSLNASNISSGTLPVARGGTGVTMSTGSGSVVLSTSPTFTGTTTLDTVNSSGIITTTGSGFFVAKGQASAYPTGSGNMIMDYVASPGYGRIDATNGSSSPTELRLQSNGGSATVAGSEICRQNGVGCPQRFAYADIFANSGGCSVQTGVANSNIASCSRSSLGNFTVGFSAGAFTSNSPFCVVNTQVGSYQPTVAAGPPGTVASVSTYNNSGGAADTSFRIMCIG
jgi:hypothetical protein